MYIYKAEDEEMKNRKESDKNLVTGYMPADDINHDTSPVRNFTYYMYLSKLNPKCDHLWQYPKDQFSPDDQSWYKIHQ